jgi:hypothetical protein
MLELTDCSPGDGVAACEEDNEDDANRRGRLGSRAVPDVIPSIVASRLKKLSS